MHLNQPMTGLVFTETMACDRTQTKEDLDFDLGLHVQREAHCTLTTSRVCVRVCARSVVRRHMTMSCMSKPSAGSYIDYQITVVINNQCV